MHTEIHMHTMCKTQTDRETDNRQILRSCRFAHASHMLHFAVLVLGPTTHIYIYNGTYA